MTRTIKIAAVQMEITPAPLAERLSRAGDLVAEAAASGADLVVLPELFNTGYSYAETNYARTETIDGETVTWMHQQAETHDIHLAGSLLLLDHDHVYNAALLIAPDGRLWRYDKQYPWGWERAFFREGDRITIADTDLGKLGMMICWDSAHPELWQRYAGRVDAMLLVSCPPDMHQMDVIFPDGERLSSDWPDDTHFAYQDIHDQAAWMQVPVVHSSGTGKLHSHFPLPKLTMGPMLARYYPDELERFNQLPDAIIEAGYKHYTRIIDSSGETAGVVEVDTDGFTLAEVRLADEPPIPQGEQPPMRTPPEAYIFSDLYLPALMSFVYQRGLRRQWGGKMAPVDTRTKIWAGALVIATLVGWLVGRFGRGR